MENKQKLPLCVVEPISTTFRGNRFRGTDVEHMDPISPLWREEWRFTNPVGLKEVHKSYWSVNPTEKAFRSHLKIFGKKIVS